MCVQFQRVWEHAEASINLQYVTFTLTEKCILLYSMEYQVMCCGIMKT